MWQTHGASQVVVMVKNLTANAGDIRDAGSIPALGRPPGGGHGNPFNYSWLENSMDRGAWWAIVHKVAKSQTKLKPLSMHTCDKLTAKRILNMESWKSFLYNQEQDKDAHSHHFYSTQFWKS